jgi:hypothetical protein
MCERLVPGYPVPDAANPAVSPPWEIGVRAFGPSCDEILGKDGAARVQALIEYATEYNRLMFEHHKKQSGKK